jgi:hypothetical protein
VVRYYYHQIVKVDGKVNNVWDNIRKGLDVIKALNFKDAHQARE